MFFAWWVLLAGIHEGRRDIARRIDASAGKFEVDTAVQAEPKNSQTPDHIRADDLGGSGGRGIGG